MTTDHAAGGDLPLFQRHFGGVKTMKEHDRLEKLLLRVKRLMADGRWRTFEEIVQLVGGSEAGVSARLRDLRKWGFGSHTVNRQRRGPIDGLYEYQLVINWERETDLDRKTWEKDLREQAERDGVKGKYDK